MIECEACGHMNKPEDTVMFQGEMALCSDEWECDERILIKRECETN